MKHKTLHFLIPAIAAIVPMLTGCQKFMLTPDGNQKTEIRSVQSFTGIESNGASPVYVTYGEELKVEVRGSANLLKHFQSRVAGRQLVLGFEGVSLQRSDVSVYVTMPEMERAALSGSGTMEIEGSFPAKEQFKAEISGSGEIRLNGDMKTKSLVVDLSGSGAAYLENLDSEKAEVQISGSGSLHCRISDLLKARISGSGDVYYYGNPTVDSRISGSGKTRKM
ncbi:head GIN domain-containing protein [Pedobacter sp. SYP-B3415]|uniref:head GIN domain-containing protein n=1 Tax=Pedobacter sp. SYP-B3415 TaxID=2496641 RepID=UPI00101DAE9B|nr:head GIN domain-containing protein [Pedobacter sp. SYP-B3415]